MSVLEDVYAFQKTAAAEGLTFEQCAEEVIRQKAVIEQLQQPVSPAEDAAEYLLSLKAERLSWDENKPKWSENMPLWIASVAALDDQIRALENG
ncbi:hypothetical protein [Aliamphritea ceti]|uniref:hypothetical protein n=1 Tax=Aliamphritea ceti TaxID=1524258 RepID=UPI0021C315E1|nr:hypothetical protein [Aliamphritea ceti]